VGKSGYSAFTVEVGVCVFVWDLFYFFFGGNDSNSADAGIFKRGVGQSDIVIGYYSGNFSWFGLIVRDCDIVEVSSISVVLA